MECEWCRKLICIKISSLRIADKDEICLSLPIVWNCQCWQIYVRCNPTEKVDIFAFRCSGHWMMLSVLSRHELFFLQLLVLFEQTGKEKKTKDNQQIFLKARLLFRSHTNTKQNGNIHQQKLHQTHNQK